MRNKKSSYLDMIKAANQTGAAAPTKPMANVISITPVRTVVDDFTAYCKAKGIGLNSTVATVIAAYSDCNGTNAAKERNLSFMPDQPFDGLSFVRVVRDAMPQGYNNFDAAVAEKIVHTFGIDSRYWLGREGSPVVYVTMDLKYLVERLWLNRICADEVSLETDGRFRLWFD